MTCLSSNTIFGHKQYFLTVTFWWMFVKATGHVICIGQPMNFDCLEDIYGHKR